MELIYLFAYNMNKQIQQLTELTSVADSDELVISDGSVEVKKITRKNLVKYPAITLGTSETGVVEFDGGEFYINI